MKNLLHLKAITASIVCFLSITFVHAQSTGYINRPATQTVITTGPSILNPNGDNYTSATSAGFGGNDVANSELPYRSVPSFSAEPFGDLRRGPSHLYSDFVPDANNVGYYAYFDGTNLLFRFRMGSIMPGSKGYSVLLDTDGKFGATGANADPDYQPATTGTSGNPGFEIEIVLETNSRIAIYNVAGSSTATLIKSYTNWTDMSQISIAGTFDNGDPDFFIDFFIPFSDLTASPFSITNTTPLRMSATTVMSPQAAIGGPKSDIYGLSDAGYKGTNEQYEAYINAQPPFTTAGLTSGGFGSMCTEAPTVTNPISPGTVNISGTWTKSSLTDAAGTATITVYKNGTSVGTVSNVTSGTTWTLNNISLANGDIVTAKAQGSGESMCLVSNSVTALGCQPTNMSSVSSITVTCGTLRGFDGNAPATAVVRIYTVTSGGYTLYADETTTTYKVNRSGTRWTYDGVNVNSADPCTGGATDVPAGSYAITIQEPGKCESDYYYYCNGLGTTTATPVITQTNLYSGSATISGTAASGATARLFINRQLRNSATATGGNYSFSNVVLNLGDIVDVYAQSTSQCISAKATRTVTCYTSTPLITVDNNNQMTAGQPITGTSSESTGTTIRVYISPANTLVSTITVQSDGTWTTGVYTAVAGTSYYATAQNGSCGVSAASGIAVAKAATTGRCGTITGPVISSTNPVTGTITGSVSSTTVTLYLDGISIGSTTTNGTAWSIAANTTVNNILYSNGVLTIGVQESDKQEQYCSASATTITCSSGPAAPNISPTNSAIVAGQTQTYTIDNAVVGAFYGIANASTGQSLGDGVWATSNTVNLTTTNLSTNSYTVAVKGTSLSGVSICSSAPANASLLVSSVLPLNLLNFTATKGSNGVILEWTTENEIGTKSFEIERSNNGINYNKLGEKPSQNTRVKTTYSYVDEQPQAVNYYRLKMVDEDAKFTYSKVIVINQKGAWYSTILPNPFVQSFSVQVYLPSSEQLKIQLLDMNGRLIRYKSIYGNAGNNNLEFNDVGNLQPGLYLVRIIRTESVIEQKIIKGMP